MFSALFWKKTAERAIKSFAQSLAAVLAASGLGLLTARWMTALSTAGMVALLSVLTSVASCKLGPEDDPSMVNPAEPAASTPSPPPVTAPA
ncbi:MAG TPA: holin [Nocardioidaceae bacterium]|jgi:hypothetical protein